MDHYLLIPKGHPKAQLLTTLTEELLSVVNADTIFLSVDNTLAGYETLFTIIIDATFTDIDAELQSIADRIFTPYPDIGFRIFSNDYANDALIKGNLYFLIHTTLGEIIYSNPSSTCRFFPESSMLLPSINRAKKQYKRKQNGISGRFSDYPSCIKHEEFANAVFILHQMLEQLFKTASNFLMGKQNLAKDIGEQQKAIRMYAPSLAGLFDPNDEEESRLLKLLYEVYIAYRKKEKIVVSRHDTEKLLFKTQWAKQEVERLFKVCTLYCLNKAKDASKLEELQTVQSPDNLPANQAANLTPAMEEVSPLFHPAEPSKNTKKLLVKAIDEYVSTSGIYCFSMRNTSRSHANLIYEEHVGNEQNEHYYLLVIVNEDKRNAIGDLSNIIKTKSKGKCTATLLIHKATSLRNLTRHQLYFFYQAMTKGYTLYQNEVVPPGIPFSGMEKRKTNLLRAYWKSRERIASTFLDSEYQIDLPATEVVKEAMMHIAVEQICLGLIEVFLSYRPLNHSLGYLFDLCEIFCPLTSEYFPRNTAHDIELFELLNAHPSMLRHAEVKDIGFANTELLEKRCAQFYEKAYEMIEAELERLENLEI